ncbi:MAG: AI-2E family transporter, partial [Clostridiales bacterium]|nr:AI-2E family transporter [Clostridiales bacterium]
MNRPQTTVEDNWITRNRKTVLKVLGLVVLFAALYFVRRHLLAALQPFFYGIVLAFLFSPLANRLDAMGVKRWQSALLLALLLLALMVLFVGLFIPSVVRDALQLAQRLPSGVASLRVKYADEIARGTDWMAGLGTDIPSNLGTRLG